MHDKFDHARGWFLKAESDLHKLCSELVPPLRFPDVDLAELTPYAVQLRYDFEFWLDRETVQQALHIAECVRVAVLATVPQEAHP